MINLWGLIPIQNTVNLWVGLSLLPLINLFTAFFEPIHRGKTKYVTWFVYGLFFYALVQVNYPVIGLFSISNGVALFLYWFTAYLGYCMARDGVFFD